MRFELINLQFPEIFVTFKKIWIFFIVLLFCLSVYRFLFWCNSVVYWISVNFFLIDIFNLYIFCSRFFIYFNFLLICLYRFIKGYYFRTLCLNFLFAAIFNIGRLIFDDIILLLKLLFLFVVIIVIVFLYFDYFYLFLIFYLLYIKNQLRIISIAIINYILTSRRWFINWWIILVLFIVNAWNNLYASIILLFFWIF